MANSFLSRWLTAKNQPVEEETPKAEAGLPEVPSSAASSTPAVPTTPDLTQYQEVQDMIVPVESEATLGHIKEKWMANDDVVERGILIKEHPFFQQKDFLQQLDVEMYLSLVTHLTTVLEGVDTKKPSNNSLKLNERMAALMSSREMGAATSFLKIHARGFELTSDASNQALPIHQALSNHWNVLIPFILGSNIKSNHGDQIMAGLEQMASVGFAPDKKHLSPLLGTYSYQKPNLLAYIETFPLLYEAWAHPSNDKTALQWSLLNTQFAHWTLQCHPRINQWAMAEEMSKYQSTAKESISALAENFSKGALLKAWYGIELSAEEIGRHPLAQSLYVYKHAPEYLEEVRPLPESWSMALSLSSTGGEFSEMLLIAAKAKMNPNVAAPSLALPELGDSSYGVQ